LFFFLPIAVGNMFFVLGKFRNCRRINYAPKTTPQIEEAVHKVNTTRKLMGSNWLFFGIRHP
jgi:DNA-binding transcriptional MocR family regulator